MSAAASIPNHSGVRLVASHCAGCREELDAPYVSAYYLDKNLTRRIQYYLCRPCGQRLERAGRAKRKRLFETVEHNLAEMGVFIGLERQGGEA